MLSILKKISLFSILCFSILNASDSYNNINISSFDKFAYTLEIHKKRNEVIKKNEDMRLPILFEKSKKKWDVFKYVSELDENMARKIQNERPTLFIVLSDYHWAKCNNTYENFSKSIENFAKGLFDSKNFKSYEILLKDRRELSCGKKVASN